MNELDLGVEMEATRDCQARLGSRVPSSDVGMMNLFGADCNRGVVFNLASVLS